MYALVFWTATQTRSVVKISNLIPEKEEGEVTFVKKKKMGGYTKLRLFEKVVSSIKNETMFL